MFKSSISLEALQYTPDTSCLYLQKRRADLHKTRQVAQDFAWNPRKRKFKKYTQAWRTPRPCTTSLYASARKRRFLPFFDNDASSVQKALVNAMYKIEKWNLGRRGGTQKGERADVFMIDDVIMTG